MSAPSRVRSATPEPPRILPLEAGDNLTAEEFLRRYEAMPEIRKAELIEGVVYMPSPVRWDPHGLAHADLMGWLAFYRAYTKGVRAGDNSTLRLDVKNVHQPDAMLIVEPSHGGKALVTPRGYLKGSPELAAQVAASTASIDLHQKFRVFQKHHIQEYIVWRVRDQAIDWFQLRGSRYERMPPQEGTYRSKVFPGLWLDGAALVNGDMVQVFKLLQQGIESSEHSRFVKKLQDAAKKHQ